MSGIKHTVAAWWGGLGPVRRWRALRQFDLSRPVGVSKRQYAAFVRSQATCVLRGHVDPMTLHKIEETAPRRDGGRMKMTLREACARCGFPLDEKVGMSKAHLPSKELRDRWRQGQ